MVLGPWPEPADLVVRTGAWIPPDERPLSAESVAFLEAGEPPVYAGFGSMPMRDSKDVARVDIEAVRATMEIRSDDLGPQHTADQAQALPYLFHHTTPAPRLKTAIDHST